MVATEKQEMEIEKLGQIRRMVDGLGKESYIGSAMQGVWDLIQTNIDTMSFVTTDSVINSLIADAGEAARNADKYRIQNETLQRMANNLQARNESLEDANLASTAEINAILVEKENLDADLTREIEGLREDLDEAESRICSLTMDAEMYGCIMDALANRQMHLRDQIAKASKEIMQYIAGDPIGTIKPSLQSMQHLARQSLDMQDTLTELEQYTDLFADKYGR